MIMRLFVAAGAAAFCVQAAPAVQRLRAADVLPPPVINQKTWKPVPGLRWQVQYEGAIDLSVQADAFMLDLFDTDPKIVAALKNRGKRIVCYLNAGAWENWRPDRKRFPARVLGRNMRGWPGERWLDIRRSTALRSIMSARLDLCRDKGFDGVIFDNVNSYQNKTGFPLKPADQLRYSAWLGNAARAKGLAPGMNNNSAHAAELEPYFDWAQAESCLAEGWCAEFQPFSTKNKAITAIEYTDMRFDRSRACARAAALRLDLIVKHRALDAFREHCSPAHGFTPR